MRPALRAGGEASAVMLARGLALLSPFDLRGERIVRSGTRSAAGGAGAMANVRYRKEATSPVTP